MLRAYRKILEKHPIVTQAVQTGFLMGAGDVIAQVTLDKKTLLAIDVRRTGTFTAIGFFYLGPSLRLWYGTLQSLFGTGGQPKVALKKVVLDQVLFAPAVLASILTIVPLANGQSLNEAKEKLGKEYWPVLKANYQIWPWVQIANFYWVPLQYQVLVVQVVALFWNVFVSWKANSPMTVDTKEK
ncbi:protein Mpv17-like [Cloeon dipterum]|uniref:protein Mpv17-like n=1 Tax=Cloeon dipterum TaxID=197152 RepID=UPI00321FC2FF